MFRRILCVILCLSIGPIHAETTWSAESLDALTTDQEALPDPDPVNFLVKCTERYKDDHIKNYRSILLKQETIDKKLQPREEIEFLYRDQPYSVFMHWLKGQRKADTALYVRGENSDQLLIHPAGLAGALVKVVARDPEGSDARQAGRYSMKETGLLKGIELSLNAWRAAKEAGTLHVRYLGVRNLREAGDRPCYTMRRTYEKPDEEGVSEVTLYIDKQTWFQIGAVLKDSENRLIGEYIFKDIQLNAPLKDNQFTRAAVAP
jgi:hypothetical protein